MLNLLQHSIPNISRTIYPICSCKFATKMCKRTKPLSPNTPRKYFYEYQEKIKVPDHLPKEMHQLPIKIPIKRIKRRTKLYDYPLPLHDYINFKTMSMEEIILNMENCELFRNGELVSSLLELGKRVRNKEQSKSLYYSRYVEVDWKAWPLVSDALTQLENKLPHLQVYIYYIYIIEEELNTICNDSIYARY